MEKENLSILVKSLEENFGGSVLGLKTKGAI